MLNTNGLTQEIRFQPPPELTTPTQSPPSIYATVQTALGSLVNGHGSKVFTPQALAKIVSAMVQDGRFDQRDLTAFEGALHEYKGQGLIDDTVAKNLYGQVIGELGFRIKSGELRFEGDAATLGLVRSYGPSFADGFDAAALNRAIAWASGRAVSQSITPLARDGELTTSDLEAVWNTAAKDGKVTLQDVRAMFGQLDAMLAKGRINATQHAQMLDALTDSLAARKTHGDANVAPAVWDALATLGVPSSLVQQIQELVAGIPLPSNGTAVDDGYLQQVALKAFEAARQAFPGGIPKKVYQLIEARFEGIIIAVTAYQQNEMGRYDFNASGVVNGAALQMPRSAFTPSCQAYMPPPASEIRVLQDLTSTSTMTIRS